MTTRCGFIAVLGMPNAGKSTLINNMVGEKVSIVSHKRNTTRTRILGIKCVNDAQMILIDTPGIIFNPSCTLQRKMSNVAWNGATESDVNVLLIDAAAPIRKINDDILESLTKYQVPLFVALNKIDLIDKTKLLHMIDHYRRLHEGIENFFLISGKNKSGVEYMELTLSSLIPEREWMFAEETLSDVSNKFMAAEITREKIFKYLHKEVPYSTHVETEHWYSDPKEKEWLAKDGISVYQTIFVETLGQKKLVIGKGGYKIKMIGQESREELSRILDKKIHLFLHVKVLGDWKEKGM